MRAMGEVDEVQEQIKVDMSALKDQMASMMEAMLSIRRLIKSKAATAAAASTAVEADPILPSATNQAHQLTPEMPTPEFDTTYHARERESYSSFYPRRVAFPVYRGHPRRASGACPSGHRLIPHIHYEGRTPNALPNTARISQPCPMQPLHFSVGGPPSIEYAQRWRDLAAQVAPPMVEREMITMIVDTLPVFYYEKLVGYMPFSFVDLVFVGERIEVGLKRGKPYSKEAFGVCPAIEANPSMNSNTGRNPPVKKLLEFAPIFMSYGDLFPSLITNQLALVTPGKIYQSPVPKWNNPNATCAYHGCVALKPKVQSLIDAGWLTFQEDGLNVKTNPLANHGGLMCHYFLLFLKPFCHQFNY
ncbi:hypothetical protein HKD37_14G040185 [Glycine soja]